jgi:hypothetical protein
MRCTFYVEHDVLEPWDEELTVPPHRGAVIARFGTQWLVTRVRFTEWPGISQREASIWLSLAADEERSPGITPAGS